MMRRKKQDDRGTRRLGAFSESKKISFVKHVWQSLSELWTFQILNKGSMQTTHCANIFPRIAMMLCGLSIKYAG